MGAKTIFLIFSITVILLSASISQSAFADGTIDQNNLGALRAGAFPLPNPIIGQVFTPTVTQLDAVEIEILSDSLEGEQQFIVNIHQGIAFGGPFFTSAGSATLPPVCDEPPCVSVIHIDLTTPIPLTPGAQHILEIIPDIQGMGWFLANVPDPYPGGFLIILNMPQPADLIFATLFLQPGNTPPVAVVQDVTVSADSNCEASASIDNGSFDPDGDDITLSQEPSGLYPLGDTLVTLTVSDGTDSDSDMATVTVTDVTPPDVSASLVPVDVEEDEGLFRVEFSAGDNCDANPAVNALLNGEPVTNGQLVELEIDDDNEVEFDDGILEMEAPSFELIVSSTDASGNTGVGRAIPMFVDEDDEDDECREEENDSNESHESHESDGSDSSDSSGGSNNTASTTCPDDTDGSESSDSSHD